MKKYVFKPYSKIFPELFRAEKERIAAVVKSATAIEHVGSTAIPGLGGGKELLTSPLLLTNRTWT